MRGVLGGLVIVVAVIAPALTFSSSEIWTSAWGAIVVVVSLGIGLWLVRQITGERL